MKREATNTAINFFANSVMALLILGAAIFLLLIDYQSLMESPQLSVSRKMGVPWMPSYGLKTASWYVLHGDIRQAIQVNPFILIVAPMIFLAFFKSMNQVIKNLKFLLN